MRFTSFALIGLGWFVVAVSALSLGILADLHQGNAPAFPLLPVLVTQAMLNCAGVVLIKLLGVTQIDGYRWYMPFEGGQSFVLVTAAAMTIAVNCVIGIAAYYFATFYINIVYGILTVQSAAVFVSHLMLLFALTLFEPNSPNEWHWLVKLASSPNRETAIVSAMVGFIVLVSLVAEWRQSIRIPLAFVGLLLHVGCGVVVHVVIGWKLTPNYRLFMPFPNNRTSTGLQQCFIWLSWTFVLQGFIALVIIPPTDAPSYAYISAGLASGLSIVALIVFVRTFSSAPPPSSSLLANHGLPVLGMTAFVLTAEIVLAGIIAERPDYLPFSGSWLASTTTSMTAQPADAPLADGLVGHYASKTAAAVLFAPGATTAVVRLSDGALAAIDASQQICAAFLISIPAATHLIGGLVHGSRYPTFQPFKGTVAFVTLQGIGWALFSFALFFLILSVAIDKSDEIHRMWMATFALTMMGAELVLMASVRAFGNDMLEAKAQREERRRVRAVAKEERRSKAKASASTAAANGTSGTEGELDTAAAASTLTKNTSSTTAGITSSSGNFTTDITSTDVNSSSSSSSSSTTTTPSSSSADEAEGKMASRSTGRSRRGHQHSKKHKQHHHDTTKRNNANKRKTLGTTMNRFFNGEMIIALILGAFGFIIRTICDTLLMNGFAIMGGGTGMGGGAGAGAGGEGWDANYTSAGAEASFWGPSGVSSSSSSGPAAGIMTAVPSHIRSTVPAMLIVSTGLLAVATPLAHYAHRKALQQAGLYTTHYGGNKNAKDGASGGTLFQGPGEATGLQAVGWTVYAVVLIIMVTSCFEPVSAEPQFFPYTLEAMSALVPFAFVSMSMYVRLKGAEGKQAAQREAILDLKLVLKAAIRDPLARNEVGNRIDHLLQIALGGALEDEDTYGEGALDADGQPHVPMRFGGEVLFETAFHGLGFEEDEDGDYIDGDEGEESSTSDADHHHLHPDCSSADPSANNSPNLSPHSMAHSTSKHGHHHNTSKNRRGVSLPDASIAAAAAALSNDTFSKTFASLSETVATLHHQQAPTPKCASSGARHHHQHHRHHGNRAVGGTSSLHRPPPAAPYLADVAAAASSSESSLTGHNNADVLSASNLRRQTTSSSSSKQQQPSVDLFKETFKRRKSDSQMAKKRQQQQQQKENGGAGDSEEDYDDPNPLLGVCDSQQMSPNTSSNVTPMVAEASMGDVSSPASSHTHHYHTLDSHSFPSAAILKERLEANAKRFTNALHHNNGVGGGIGASISPKGHRQHGGQQLQKGEGGGRSTTTRSRMAANRKSRLLLPATTLSTDFSGTFSSNATGSFASNATPSHHHNGHRSADRVGHNPSAALIVAQMAGFTLLAFIVALVQKGKQHPHSSFYGATTTSPSNYPYTSVSPIGFFTRFTSQPKNEILATMFAFGGTILMSVCVIMTQLVYGPFIHGQAFRFAMPFRGGYAFVGLQSVGWGLFSAAWAIFILYVCEMTHGFAPLAVGCVLCLAAEVFVFLSIPYFRTRSKPPSFVEENSEAVITALTFIIAFFLMRSVETLAGNHASPISILISTVALCIALPLAAIALRKSSHTYGKRLYHNDLEDEGAGEKDNDDGGSDVGGGVGGGGTLSYDQIIARIRANPPTTKAGIKHEVSKCAEANRQHLKETDELADSTLLAGIAGKLKVPDAGKTLTAEEEAANVALLACGSAEFRMENAQPTFISPLFSPMLTDTTSDHSGGAQGGVHSPDALGLSPADGTATAGGGGYAVPPALRDSSAMIPVTSANSPTAELLAQSNARYEAEYLLQHQDDHHRPLGGTGNFRPTDTSTVASDITASYLSGGGGGRFGGPGSIFSGGSDGGSFTGVRSDTNISGDFTGAAAEVVGVGIGGLPHADAISGNEEKDAQTAAKSSDVASKKERQHLRGHKRAVSDAATVKGEAPPIAHIKRTPSLLLEAEQLGEIEKIDPRRRRAKLLGVAGAAAVRPPLLALEYFAFAVVAVFPLLILFLSYYAVNDYAVGVASTLSAERIAFGLLTVIIFVVIFSRTRSYAKFVDCFRTYLLFMIPVVVVGTGFAFPVILPTFGTYALAATIILLTFFPGRWRMFVSNGHMALLALVCYTHGKGVCAFVMRRLAMDGGVMGGEDATAPPTATTASSSFLPCATSSPSEYQVFNALLTTDMLTLFLTDLTDFLNALAAFLLDLLPICACIWYGKYLKGHPETDGSHYVPGGLRLVYAELFSHAERFFDVRVLADDLQMTREAQKVRVHHHHHHIQSGGDKNKADTTPEKKGSNATDEKDTIATTIVTSTTGGAIIGFHPHGVFPVTCLWFHFTRRWERMFRGCPRVVSHGASIVFNTPMLRDIAMLVGTRVVTKKAIEKVISDSMTPLIVPGGQAEMIHSFVSDREMHIVTYHIGFIRLAMQHGRSVIPVMSFGEQDVLGNVRFPKMQSWFLKRVGFGFPVLPLGQWNLPFPLKAALRIAIGKPVRPDAGEDDYTNPAHVQKVADKYFAELRYIFYKYRGEAGYPFMELYYHHNKKDPLEAVIQTPTPQSNPSNSSPVGDGDSAAPTPADGVATPASPSP